MGLYSHGCPTKTWYHICGICVTNAYQDVLCDTCDPWHAMCLILFTVTNFQASEKVLKKATESRKQDGHRERIFKTVHWSNRSKDGEIKLISEKVWRKIK